MIKVKDRNIYYFALIWNTSPNLVQAQKLQGICREKSILETSNIMIWFVSSKVKNHFREQSFSENVSKLLPHDFDTWNTREKILSQSPRKAFQEGLMLVYFKAEENEC